MSKLPEDIRRMALAITRAVEDTIPRRVGKEGVDYFKKSFADQGWDGKPWKDVKRRDSASSWYGFNAGAKRRRPGVKARKKEGKGNFSKAATTRAILKGPAASLVRSLRYRKEAGGRVIWSSSRPYAKVQNEGGKIKVFGKATRQLAKRQFMGYSTIFDLRIDQIVELEMKKAQQ